MSLKWDGRECWALVLGASSGFGAATARAWARAGFGIIGVHLDLRSSIASADAVREEIEALGVPVVYHNVNAADDEKRATVVAAIAALFEERRSAGESPSAPRSTTSPTIPAARSSRAGRWR
jgi:NAD(P)-dependent dehydrogenase (short-subunit alcohol dehydrogenase family)